MPEYSREWLADVDRRFGERVRIERESRNLSQSTIALTLQAMHGMTWHQTTMAKVEAGTRPVKLNEALAVASALGLGLDDLLDDPDSPGAIARRAERLQGRLLELGKLSGDIAARYTELQQQAADMGGGDDDGEHQEAR